MCATLAILLGGCDENTLASVELALRPDQVFTGPHRRERVVIPVNGLNRAVVQAVNFGRSLSTVRSTTEPVGIGTRIA